MTRKSVQQFSDKAMPKNKGMTRKSVQRFSDKVMPKNKGA
jgi:hypothetical protein